MAKKKPLVVEIHPFGTIVQAASMDDAEAVAKKSLDDAENDTRWDDLPHGKMLLERRRFGIEGDSWYAVATIYLQ